MNKRKIQDRDIHTLKNLISRIKDSLSNKSGNPQLRSVIDRELSKVETFLEKESTQKVLTNVNSFIEILTKIINIIKILVN